MQPSSLYFPPLNKIKEKMRFLASCPCPTNAGKKTTNYLPAGNKRDQRDAQDYPLDHSVQNQPSLT